MHVACTHIKKSKKLIWRKRKVQNQTEIPAIKIENLVKQYPAAQAIAVNDLSIECYPGQIVGLLGHNGAGKSTTLKCLTGILPYNSGKITINGYDLAKDPVKAKYTFGFVSDKHDVFVKLTGIQYINFMADAYGVSAEERKQRLAQLDEVFQFGNRLFDPISDYSHGMRQKICMMGSLIHRPKLWILDEPMIGLDPITSARVADYMRGYAAQGNCILFSSHNINSVQQLCERAIIIQHGIKTDDFYVEKFKEEHPNINLEYYFLTRTQQRQDQPAPQESENIETK